MAAVAAVALGSTTVSVPFIPASLWPGIEQKKSNTPALSNGELARGGLTCLGQQREARGLHGEVVLHRASVVERERDLLAHRHLDASRG